MHVNGSEILSQRRIMRRVHTREATCTVQEKTLHPPENCFSTMGLHRNLRITAE